MNANLLVLYNCPICDRAPAINVISSIWNHRAKRHLRCAVCHETWDEIITDHGNAGIEREILLTPAQQNKQDWYIAHEIWHRRIANHERYT